MKKTVLTLALLLTLLTGTCCPAGGAAVDKQSVYQAGLDYASMGMYKNALEQFTAVGAYKDSVSWQFYCQGMIGIENANSFEQLGYLSDATAQVEAAGKYFEILSNSAFRDSERIKRYLSARRYELKGLTQSALDIYAGLLDVLDSGERYLRLLKGTPLPTQAPVVTLPERLTAYPAHIVRKAVSYFGPGDRYAEQTAVALRSDMAVSILGREDSYYLVEFDSPAGKLRAWVPTIRVRRDGTGTEPEVGGKGKSARVINAAEGLRGPGNEYAKSGVTLTAGQMVTAFEAEGLYTMIEAADAAGRRMRLWLPTDQLSVRN